MLKYFLGCLHFLFGRRERNANFSNFCSSDTHFFKNKIGKLQCRTIDFAGKVNKTLSEV